MDTMREMEGDAPAVVSRLAPISSEEEIRHPKLRGLYTYWNSKRDGRLAPARRDIDPVEMLEWLPHLILADIEAASSDIRFRVIGTWMVDRIGRDDTGMRFGDIGLTPSRQAILDSYLTVASVMKPHYSEGSFLDRAQVRRHIETERVLLPLSGDGQACDMVLTGIYFREEDERPPTLS